jgi:hypothetical protein
MARRLVASLARRRSTKVTWPRENGSSGISPPSKSSRTFSLETPTPVMTTTTAKKLYVMYGGSWELTSCSNVKSLHCEVLSATPGVPKAAPHQRWQSTTISFRAFDCLENMAGAGILPLITAPIIANMRLHHVLIDGGAGLNVISHAAFKQLKISGSRLGPSRPFSGVGPQPVYPLGASHSRLHSGLRRTSTMRTSRSTLRRLTSLSMPSLAGWPYTGSWPLPITGTWSSRCCPLLRSSSCGATAPLRLQLLRSCMPWRQKPLARMTAGGTPRLPVPRRISRCLRCIHLEHMAVPSRPSRLAWILPTPLALRAI